METYKANLISKKLITDYLGIFTFEPEKKIDFQPGQYVTLSIKKAELKGKGVQQKHGSGIVRRPYSVASSPKEDFIELYC